MFCAKALEKHSPTLANTLSNRYVRADFEGQVQRFKKYIKWDEYYQDEVFNNIWDEFFNSRFGVTLLGQKKHRIFKFP